jgi:hypothetical protein
MHLCTCVSEEGGDGEATRSDTPALLSYTLRCVSFAEVDRVCRVSLREPMHMCTCVSEETCISQHEPFLFKKEILEVLASLEIGDDPHRENPRRFDEC